MLSLKMETQEHQQLILVGNLASKVLQLEAPSTRDQEDLLKMLGSGHLLTTDIVK